MEKFKSGEVPLLIATDVAARGLDIPDVEAVISYSFPLTTEDYVHRIGRTGRAGKTGETASRCWMMACDWASIIHSRSSQRLPVVDDTLHASRT